MDAISISGACKSFGPKRAVKDLDLAVPAGTLFGLVGPNGAGKTTTLSMLCGILQPDSGTFTVNCHDMWLDPVAAKANLGVLPDGLRLFDRLTGQEFISYTAQLRGMDVNLAEERSQELLTVLGLADSADTLICDYSAGMTKKVAFASALVHGPTVVVLDEPFESVDPVSGETIREILRGFVRSGGTVVLSSHVMELVEALCDHVAVLADGELLISGQTDEVRAGTSLQERFVDLVGADRKLGELSWL
ncbi:bcl-2-like protein 12 [Platysternon megacephalum]|uniref:Bcl-2-like protein 12 n=1 Tax=Platysternon megacephalum TaxID=55544 RepID=A0A4D9DCQ6_9SAUR|nr:bcl-2-like protein 12 [Platysternon megacephalum]